MSLIYSTTLYHFVVTIVYLLMNKMGKYSKAIADAKDIEKHVNRNIELGKSSHISNKRGDTKTSE